METSPRRSAADSQHGAWYWGHWTAGVSTAASHSATALHLLHATWHSEDPLVSEQMVKTTFSLLLQKQHKSKSSIKTFLFLLLISLSLLFSFGFFSSSKSFKSVWGKRILRRNFCLRIRWSENTRSTSHMVTIVYIQVALIPFNGGFDLQFGQLPPLNKCLIPGQLHTFMLCLALWLFLIYAPIKTKFLKPFYSFQNILVLKPILSSQ